MQEVVVGGGRPARPIHSAMVEKGSLCMKKTLTRKVHGFWGLSARNWGQRPNTFCIMPQLAFFWNELIVRTAFFSLSALVYSLLTKEETCKAITLGSWQNSILIIVQRELPDWNQKLATVSLNL